MQISENGYNQVLPILTVAARNESEKPSMIPTSNSGNSIQYSSTIEDVAILHRFNFDLGRKNNNSRRILIPLNSLAMLGSTYIITQVRAGEIGLVLVVNVLAAIVLGFVITLVLEWDAKKRILAKAWQGHNVAARFERGDYRNQSLFIEDEGIVIDTPNGRGTIRYDDDIKIVEVDNIHTAIMAADGWQGIVVIPANRIESGDLTQFLAEVRRRIELYTKPD